MMLVLVLVCNVWCVVVCVLCVLCVVCVCCLCVARHAEKTWKNQCVDSKRLRVSIQNVTVYASNTRTCFSACERGAGTHGGDLNLHTVKRQKGVLFSLCFSSLFPLLSSLSSLLSQ